ncbi:hypothetical protein [Pseudomonas sp. G(2018)]|uniref:hypothetical protein n=1 Tax=Pseudomonas sp. G(2018) TaxID=2502242 RepID=UPI0010F78F4D|nr:hypothetical protein [Pseudomonas sp. G(2018)]
MHTLQTLNELPKKSYFGKHSVYFPSQKNQRQIVCDSILEADYCILLEFDSKVECYNARPGAFNICVNGEAQDYTPDFITETSESLYYTEVKANFEKLSSRVKIKLDAASHYFSSMGYSLKFADENTIRKGEILKNLKFLYLHSFNVGKDELGDCARQLEAITYPIRLGDLFAMGNRPSVRSTYKAMFDQSLTFDLNKRITLNTLIEGRKDGHNHPESWCTVYTGQPSV